MQEIMCCAIASCKMLCNTLNQPMQTVKTAYVRCLGLFASEQARDLFYEVILFIFSRP